MRWVALVALCACGDDRPEIEVFEPTSGTRIMIEQYQFDDGTRLVQPTAFYDRRIHARCTPQEWLDGVIRCVPDAEEAFYREDTCTTLFGVGNAIEHATHFLATDTREGVRYPARAFEQAGRTDAIAQGFRRDGESCNAVAIPELETTTYWDLGGEVGGEDLVPIRESEVGDGRLGLRVRTSDDGALVPLGFRDRDLDIDCEPMPRGDAAACEPTIATASSVFADNACTEPAILVAPEARAPLVASTRDPSGCAAYHGVATDQAPRAYRDTGTGCVSVSTTSRVLPLGPLVELAPVARAIDDAPKRRIQRILASEGDLHVHANRMFDTATRAECELRQLGDTLRCVPTALAPIVRLFLPGCTVERRFAEVPERTCEPMSFATHDTGETLELHAIGDPFDGTAYTFGMFGVCTPYAPSPGTSLYTVGPLLPDDTFAGAVPFGAR